MSIRTLFAAALLIGTASAAASAQTGTFTIDWKVNGVEGVTVAPGATVLVTGTASWDPAAFGLGGTQFRVNLTDSNLTDVLVYNETMGLGRNPLLRLTPQTLVDSVTGTGRAITASANAVIDAAQAPQFINPGFSTANPIQVFSFMFTAGGAGRTINIGSEILGATLLSNSFGQPVPTQYQRVSDGAMIQIVPTPGSFALLGVGGLMTLRRKRR
ncbi:MAG: hypothetical protein AB7G11_07830 [Phycisphaerales bacterium]